MNLNLMRRYAIRHGVRVRFHLEPAGECFVDEQGLLKIPALRGAPDFNVESLLASVEQFAIETAGKQRRVSRQELEALAGQAPKAEQERQE